MKRDGKLWKLRCIFEARAGDVEAGLGVSKVGLCVLQNRPSDFEALIKNVICQKDIQWFENPLNCFASTQMRLPSSQHSVLEAVSDVLESGPSDRE